LNRRKAARRIEEQMITPVRKHDGRITHYVSIGRRDRRRSEDQIRHLAMHDALTDLPNRRALDAAMERISFDARRGVSGALMILDVDNFKPVNDTLGHLGGDQLLAEFARLLRHTLRPADFLARLGGDEFAVLLQDASLAGAELIADRVRKQVAGHPFRFGDRVFDLREHRHCRDRRDGRCLGGDGACGLRDVRGEGSRPGSHRRVSRRRRSRHANDRSGTVGDADSQGAAQRAIRLCYQPVVRIGNGETEHYGAAAHGRRRRDDHCPGDFISAAERFGLMSQIDQWVVENVLQVLAQNDAPERIFVNISGASLGDANLLAFIEERIRAAQCHADGSHSRCRVCPIRDLAVAQDWIRKLKQLGCLFAIDDFGVGFSSFSYLRALSADYVKIDRSFVTDVDTNPTNRALVQAVMTVAQTLGKEVIAEGVEAEVHAAVLLELGIELAQGYGGANRSSASVKCGWGLTPTTPYNAEHAVRSASLRASRFAR
jgi:diguanylate cyclase (GGDEF)-like protein